MHSWHRRLQMHAKKPALTVDEMSIIANTDLRTHLRPALLSHRLPSSRGSLSPVLHRASRNPARGISASLRCISLASQAVASKSTGPPTTIHANIPPHSLSSHHQSRPFTLPKPPSPLPNNITPPFPNPLLHFHDQPNPNHSFTIDLYPPILRPPTHPQRSRPSAMQWPARGKYRRR